jgi:hypothetical protein
MTVMKVMVVKPATIKNLTLTLADTEYSYAFPEETIRFIVQCRELAEMKVAFVSGESGTNYMTIKPGVAYTEEDLRIDAIIYLQSDIAGVTAEILSWQRTT